tara:strand:+ start:54 stop:1511 length:1458 start_codon:yes stop_codon:yes gene_type:complete
VSPEKEKIALTNWEIVSVNPAEKNWNWKDIFCFWSVGIQSIVSFALIASIYLVYNLNFYEVFLGSLLAAILVCFFSNLIGKPSQKHGIPFPVFLRVSTGHRGAKFIGLLRGVVGIFFFGVQTFFISKSIGYLIRLITFKIDSSLLEKDILLNYFISMNLIDWFAFMLTIFIQYLLFSKGQKLVRSFINFSAIFVYFGLILFFIILVSDNEFYVIDTLVSRLNFENEFAQLRFNNLIGITGTLFAYFSILIINFGDYSRYVKNSSELTKGNYSLILATILYSFLLLTIVVGSDIYFKSNSITTESILTNPTDIIGKIDNTYITVTVLIFILFASASTNLIVNYVPSQNTLLNLLPKNLNLKTSGYLIIFFGFIIGILWTPFLSQNGSMSLIDTIACLFGPISGVIIFDYYFIKEKNVINKDIFSAREDSAYMYSHGWHLKAIYSFLIGFIFSSSTIWNPNLTFLETFSWIIGLVASGLTYYFLASD